LVRHTAIGLNFIDVYDRTGLYPTALPTGLGREAAGVVVALGRKVRGLKAGDRVAYTYPSPGAYAEMRVCPAERLVRIPAGISDGQAAAIMLKGLTAHYLLRRTYKVKRGDTVLIHAAAGGVGLIACQWARQLGAKVIGVVGSDEKAKLAKRHGCHHVIVTARQEIVSTVKSLTRSAGVEVVYDAVGKDTFLASLDCLKPLGMMVSYGNASGPVRARKCRARAVQCRSTRRRQGSHRAELPVAECGGGPPRSRGPPHHGLDGTRSLASSKRDACRGIHGSADGSAGAR
jgi:NADPH2:quinone reductase